MILVPIASVLLGTSKSGGPPRARAANVYGLKVLKGEILFTNSGIWLASSKCRVIAWSTCLRKRANQHGFSERKNAGETQWPILEREVSMKKLSYFLEKKPGSLFIKLSELNRRAVRANYNSKSCGGIRHRTAPLWPTCEGTNSARPSPRHHISLRENSAQPKSTCE